MSQKFSVDGFKCVKNTPQYCEGLIKNYSDDIEGEYFLVVDIQDCEKLHNFHSDLPFLTEGNNLKTLTRNSVNL